jgi:ribose 5-phosphate isomerase RpiB
VVAIERQMQGSMSRPVITAIWLDDLVREGVEIRMPTDALLTPAATDWIKDHDVPITWDEPKRASGALAVIMDPSDQELRLMRRILDRQGGLVDVIEPDGRKGVPAALRQLCDRVASGEVAKGVVFVEDGAMPVCLANKHHGIRAALGLDVPTVEDAARVLGINVLVLEYPTLTTYQMKQMIDRLKAGASSPSVEMVAIIEAIEQGSTPAK